MENTCTIRRMRPDEIRIAIEWAAQEGWNPGIHDAESFYLADPNGFFISEHQGQVIAVGSAVVYDENFAFCGLYIVHPDYRGQGFGIKLTRERLGYVGLRNAGIDGVVENIPIYERIGYRLAYHNMRYQGVANAEDQENKSIIPLAKVAFASIVDYDKACFPAARNNFLQAWINQPDARALGYVENGDLKGYAVRRKCVEGHKIGPVFADNFRVANALFQALQTDIMGEAVFIDITEINPGAQKLVENHKMDHVFSTGRMYLKGQPELSDNKVFGITTFELG